MQDFELQVLGRAPSDKVGVKGEKFELQVLDREQCCASITFSFF
jgi:hypothetical protein